MLEGDAQLGPVATLYGLKLGEEDGNQALGRFMAQQIGGQPVVGDQVEWNGLTWRVVRVPSKSGQLFPYSRRSHHRAASHRDHSIHHNGPRV